VPRESRRQTAAQSSAIRQRLSVPRTEQDHVIDAGNEKPRVTDMTRIDAAGDPKRPIRLQVADLMDGGREAILEHAGQDYRLRITSNGKLILTK
jgi:hemin uptake protein HemP